MSRKTRRQFLEDSMFAASAAAVAGSAVPALAAPEGSKDANERLRFAVVGVRSRGKSHLGGFSKRNDTEVAVICDADENIGQKTVENFNKSGNKSGTKATFEQDVRKVVEDPSIDCVSIATPNHWHSLIAIWAMQNGKDVYVEKPVSHNVTEGRRCVQAARKHGRICQTGTQVRSSKGVQEAFQFLRDGGIGEVFIARGLCYKRRGSIGKRGNYDVPAGVDYTLWSGPAGERPLTRPRFHYDWHWQWPYGNGDLGNQGIHQMDLARWGLGLEGLGDSVQSYGGRFGYEDAGDTANTQVSIHTYGDKRVVFEVRGLNTKALRGAKVGDIFYGTEGYLVINSYAGGAAFDNDGNMTKKFRGGGDHFGNFVEAVHSRKKEDLNADIEEGHLSSALCHLGNISYRLGTEMTAKEAEQELQGDDEAVATFERFAGHLSENGVDLSEEKIGFGRQLKLDGEKFTGGSNVAEANDMLFRDYAKGFEVPATEADV